MRFTLVKEDLNINKDRVLYRGEYSTFSNKYKSYAGLFFGPTSKSVKGWGPIKRYILEKDVKIYNGNSSDEYCSSNNLYSKKYPELKVFKNYADIESLDYFLNLTKEEQELLDKKVIELTDDRFCWYDLWEWCTQLVSKIELEKQGYDGAHWLNEDYGNPEQYQIWNLDKIKNK